MTMTRARIVIVGMFVGSLAIQAIAVIVTHSRGAIAAEDLTNLLIKLLAIYSIHLGVIFGGIFAQLQDAQQGNQPAPATAFWLAVLLAGIWNLLLVWRSISFVMASSNPDSEDNVDALSSYFQSISSASAFLVTGALTFFFAKK